ncbi:MAG: hypothetical protein IJB91_06390 [Oscillospiraceae bacterium]|nr:hypothetical protein [Oscillospiraceae bacterium]
MKVDGHYNLYYLFLEDKQKRSMPKSTAMVIRKNLQNFFKNIKPSTASKPLISTTSDLLDQNKGDFEP